MRAARLKELEELAAKLLETARKLPSGQDRHNALQEIERFRARITALQLDLLSGTEFVQEIAAPALGTQNYLIDGSWDPADLSLFFGRINDLYSFFLGIKKFASSQTTQEQKRGLIAAFTDNSLHSGFNYVNFFGDLKGLVGFDERLAMGSIVKRSPGFTVGHHHRHHLDPKQHAIDAASAADDLRIR